MQKGKASVTYEALVRGTIQAALRVAETAESAGAEVVFVRPWRPAGALAAAAAAGAESPPKTAKTNFAADLSSGPKSVRQMYKDDREHRSRFAHGMHKKGISAVDLVQQILRERKRPMKTFEFITPFIQNKFAAGTVSATLSMMKADGVLGRIGREWYLVGETTVHKGAGVETEVEIGQ